MLQNTPFQINDAQYRFGWVVAAIAFGQAAHERLRWLGFATPE